MPLPLLALAALPALAKGALGLYQLSQHVNRVDTTTPAEVEQMGMARQGAAANLPGLAQYQGRLAQAQNATVQNARLGAGSGSDLLAAGAAADVVRSQGENQLGAQGQQYHDARVNQLSNVLSAYARHQQADTDRAAQANSALKSAGLNNISNGITEGASVAAYGASGAADATGGAGGSGATPNLYDLLKKSGLPHNNYGLRQGIGPYAGHPN